MEESLEVPERVYLLPKMKIIRNALASGLHISFHINIYSLQFLHSFEEFIFFECFSKKTVLFPRKR